ncbi:MAG: S8 family serine peptidase [Acidobacteriota bacterium]
MRIFHGARSRAVVLAILLASGLTTTASFADTPKLEQTAIDQMLALRAEKLSRTPAQQKIASGLLYALDRSRGGELTTRHVPQLRTHLDRDHDGRVLIDLDGAITPLLEALVDDLGGEIVNAHPRFEAMRLWLPLDRIEELAADASVRTMRPADLYALQMINTTEGDVAHAADTARVAFGTDGTGVKACAMSDSVDALATLQGSGDLPPVVDVLAGQSGNPGSSEGTALLEILHDMAPGAELGFATGIGGPAQMAQNILDLAASGCDVIVDDILYLAEGVFQDDVIAQAVETVYDQGVFYVTSAGNSGNLDSGTSGVYEGQYSATALPAPLAVAGLSAHDFDGAGDAGNEVTEQALNPSPLFTLQWSDPLDGSTNDHDFFLLDAAMANVLAASTFTQNGTQDPVEAIPSPNDDSGNHLVVVLFDGVADRFLNVNTHRSFLEHATDGQIFGHPGSDKALTIAAVDVASAAGGVFVGGGANPSEPFTSDGPREIFFNDDGTPVLAPVILNDQNQVPPGPVPQMSTTRQKPDVAAADGVSTATPGFNPFFGTSASAPHAAAISALVKARFPNITNDELFDDFLSSALDIDDPGFDRNSGNGILMTDQALGNTQDIFSDGFESGDTTAWSSTVD